MEEQSAYILDIAINFRNSNPRPLRSNLEIIRDIDLVTSDVILNMLRYTLQRRANSGNIEVIAWVAEIMSPFFF
jgi:hypothetical protein